MKTEIIIVSNNGNGMDAALAQADRAAEQLKFSDRDALHMRLLAEEMMSMMRSIVSDHMGQFWIDATDREYRLHLKTVTQMDAGQYAQLLSAATSGRNEAHRGIMGKIRAFFEPVPVEETPVYLADTIVSDLNGGFSWSMNAYRDRLLKNMDAADDAREEWDELEKSVVSHLADNVQVSVRGIDVELTINKHYGLPG